MANLESSKLTQQLRRAALGAGGSEFTDAELLKCFLEHRDEAAISALVRRHAPMVWGVCQRHLRSYQDAEDAFQATFLVLLRKANSIQPRRMVANWLHGVALRTALKARVVAARRKTRELHVTDFQEPSSNQNAHWADLRPILDQALSRLPNQYRIVIVLCDLEGKTRKEVARELGWPEGTVAGRLARARALLASRLGKSGLVMSSSVLTAAIAEGTAAACVPSAVLGTSLRIVSQVAAGSAQAGMISAKVGSLTEGVLKAMLMSKLTKSVGIVLVVGAIAFGGGRFTQYRVGAQENQVRHSNDGDKVQKPQAAKESKRVPEPIKITTFIEPLLKDGSKGQPIPFTIEFPGNVSEEYLRDVFLRLKDKDRKLDLVLERLDRLEKLLKENGGK